jgi:hypothetical protein
MMMMRNASRKLFKASLLLLACSTAIGDERSGPVETIRSFYQRYLNSSNRQAAGTPNLAYSKKFHAEIEESASVCAKYVEGPCGWGGDTDVYLDTQETDPLLRYDNSRFAIKQLDAATVQVRFNVYPSEKDDKGFYDKLVTYRMVEEGGRWVVDDVSYRDGVSARTQLAQERANAKAHPDRPQPPAADPFGAQFGKIVPLCEELFFPNSMAREPGFDVNANQRKLEKRIEEGSRPLRTRDGLAYLNKRLASEPDDVAQACIRRIAELPPTQPGAQKR